MLKQHLELFVDLWLLPSSGFGSMASGGFAPFTTAETVLIIHVVDTLINAI